jgi:hypothetical protein
MPSLFKNQANKYFIKCINITVENFLLGYDSMQSLCQGETCQKIIIFIFTAVRTSYLKFILGNSTIKLIICSLTEGSPVLSPVRCNNSTNVPVIPPVRRTNSHLPVLSPFRHTNSQFYRYFHHFGILTHNFTGTLTSWAH